METKKTTDMKCPWKDCNYDWTTRVQAKMVTCPGCCRKINREINKNENK